jgi:hypothetical protein
MLPDQRQSIRYYFNLYTVRFCSLCTISQQLHYSDSLLVTFYIRYMFRHMYVIIGSLLLCVLLSYFKMDVGLWYIP